MNRQEIEDRFWPKVEEKEKYFGECWNWTAAHKEEGYGMFFIDGKTIGAHRVAYELLKGPIPENLELDHLCRNPPCVNPDHLEIVTSKENILRGKGIAALNVKKDVCSRGHPLSGSNLYIHPDGKHRDCKTCIRIRSQKYRAGIGA